MSVDSSSTTTQPAASGLIEKLINFNTTAWGLVAGIIVLAWIFYLYYRAKQQPQIDKCFQAMLAGGGIPSGLKVCYLAFQLSIDGIETLYIFLGGLAVIWFSVNQLIDMQKLIK